MGPATPARSFDPAARSVVRGAESSVPGLILAGLLMTIWSSVLAWSLPLAYLVIIIGGQLAILVLLARLARIMPTLEPGAETASRSTAKVSIIIPARNERQDLSLCLDDLQEQDWLQSGAGMEVLVIDGGSTDGTGEAARAHPLRPVVIDEPPLPPGWVGKNWACHQGYQRATGEVLLFLDADVRLSREAVRTAVTSQQTTKADLVTFAARIVTEGFWEKVVMPLFVQFVLLYFMLVRVDARDAPPDMANGQFMCFTREGYRRCGGHEGVRGAVLEDVRLAQQVRRAGGTVRMFSAPKLVRTRMYLGRAEMQEGILKSFQGSDLSAASQTKNVFLILLLFLTPFLVVILGVVGLLSLLWALVALAAILLTALKQVALQQPLGGSPGYGLLYPLGCILFVAIFIRAARGRLSRGKVAWKGREYATEG